MTIVTPQVVVRFIDESHRLQRRIQSKERRVLFRTGGYGRGVMRRLIRRRKKVSPPGRPPHAHKPGATGMKDVRYAVNAQAGIVTIGHPRYPVRASRAGNNGVSSVVRSRKPVPQLLNEGGSARMEITDRTRGRTSVPLNYRPRPFREKALAITHGFMLDRISKERL